MDFCPDHLRERIERLPAKVRDALEIVLHYYHSQLEPEHLNGSPCELTRALAGIRRALTCRALVAGLSERNQDHALEILAPHLPTTPLPSEAPDFRIDQIDALLQDLSIDLVSWRVRTAANLLLNDSGPLLECESFQHGDLVIVRAADGTSSPYNGHTGTFLRYSDPRIFHHDRWAVVDFGGGSDDADVFIRPAHLEFAREEEGQEGVVSRPQNDPEIEATTCAETQALESYEHLGTWSRYGFVLKLSDTGRADRRGKSVLAYQLFDENHGQDPVFQGADFHCSPLDDRASDATASDVLGFLSLRPEDSDSERFASYTAKQLAWCQERGADLAVVAEQFEQRQTWRQLHEDGETEEAVLAVARYGQTEDIFEVLDLDIFETYDLVAELCRRRGDAVLDFLLGELHYLRNVEFVGGEEELARLYE